MKKLVLVWGKKGGDRPLVIIPLAEVTEEVYDSFTSIYGVPKGRTVTNLLEVV